VDLVTRRLEDPPGVPPVHCRLGGGSRWQRRLHGGRPLSRDLVVDRSATGSNSGGFGGRSEDGPPALRTRQDTVIAGGYKKYTGS
jgi:hypothetical protein